MVNPIRSPIPRIVANLSRPIHMDAVRVVLASHGRVPRAGDLRLSGRESISASITVRAGRRRDFSLPEATGINSPADLSR